MEMIRRFAQDIADVAKQEIDRKKKLSEFRIKACERIEETMVELSKAIREAALRAYKDDYKEYVDKELTKRVKKGK